MHDLISRYIYDVTRRLPKEEREQVSLELSSQIQDMLPPESTEEQIKSVLQDLGNPALLAEQYRANPRYLISPAVYSDYISTLWKVGLIVGIIMMALMVFINLFNVSADPTFGAVVGAVIGGLASGAIIGASSTFIFVTLGFVIYEMSHQPKKEEKWTTDSLPEIEEENDGKFKKGDIISELVLSIIFGGVTIAVFAHFHQYIGWYDEGQDFIPLFNAEAMQIFLPWIIAVTVLNIILILWKLRLSKWTTALLSYNFVTHVAITGVALMFLNGSSTFVKDFIVRLAEATSTEPFDMFSYWDRGIFIISAIIVLCAITAVIVPIWQSYKSKRKEQQGTAKTSGV